MKNYYREGENMSTLSLKVVLLIMFTSLLSFSKADDCNASGSITGTTPPGECNKQNESDCCTEGTVYPTYTCSPDISSKNTAVLTINSFEEGGDGGGPSECDHKYHSDDTLVVALSTGWYNKGGRCMHNIIINGNGQSVTATVVDECDSTTGCDKEHSYQPPCSDNIVDGSRAVWDALGVPHDNRGQLDITWSDA